MHIAIDALFRLSEGGGRTHLEALIGAWQSQLTRNGDHITIFTTSDGANSIGRLRSVAVDIRTFDWPGRSVIRRLLWEQLSFPRVLATHAPDVLLCPGNMSPLVAGLPVVLMLRTMAPFCADPAIRARFVGQMMRLSAKRATQVIANSSVTADLALRNFGVVPERVTVIPHGYDTKPAPLTHKQRDETYQSLYKYNFPYLLCVSAIRRYKCIAELISGFAQIYRNESNPDQDWRLVIAGLIHNTEYAAELRAHVAKLGLIDRVIFLGAVSRTEIDRLLGGALAMVYNSTCENFPLPLLEAMAANVPVACSRLPALLDVAGDAAITFEARVPDEIAAALIQLRDPALRAALITRGQARLTHFERWEQTAERMRVVLAKAVSNG